MAPKILRVHRLSQQLCPPMATPAAGDQLAQLVSAHSLAGKRAFVSGARKGIGRGVALSLARAGCAAVCIADIVDDDASQEVVALINEAGATGSLIVADLSTVAAIQSAIDSFAADGGIDILVNNAIIPHSPPDSTQCSPVNCAACVGLPHPRLALGPLP